MIISHAQTFINYTSDQPHGTTAKVAHVRTQARIVETTDMHIHLNDLLDVETVSIKFIEFKSNKTDSEKQFF